MVDSQDPTCSVSSGEEVTATRKALGEEMAFELILKLQWVGPLRRAGQGGRRREKQGAVFEAQDLAQNPYWEGNAGSLGEVLQGLKRLPAQRQL